MRNLSGIELEIFCEGSAFLRASTNSDQADRKTSRRSRNLDNALFKNRVLACPPPIRSLQSPHCPGQKAKPRHKFATGSFHSPSRFILVSAPKPRNAKSRKPTHSAGLPLRSGFSRPSHPSASASLFLRFFPSRPSRREGQKVFRADPGFSLPSLPAVPLFQK